MAGAQPGLAGSEECVQGAVLCMGRFDPYSTSATLLKAGLPACLHACSDEQSRGGPPDKRSQLRAAPVRSASWCALPGTGQVCDVMKIDGVALASLPIARSVS